MPSSSKSHNCQAMLAIASLAQSTTTVPPQHFGHHDHLATTKMTMKLFADISMM
ncbi:hypothetical protein LOAG_03900 [Loa loa]|uniref:Uncharacterized protein n=1 Tax=Loa loa TaxID=7209 RepID=A0A1S0U3C5_LOALO|nr:hypothetical protein LOAG_03900 [Loa loa]EFO24589.1 hypothetical protein LOAG_03900 [Loa loa]